MSEETTPPKSTPETILKTLHAKDPVIAFRDSLRFMYVETSRTFPKLSPDEAGVIADHYLALDAFLQQAECLLEE